MDSVDAVTVTKNKILAELNKPDDWWLVVVKVGGEAMTLQTYLYRTFQHEPDFAATIVNFELNKLFKVTIE